MFLLPQLPAAVPGVMADNEPEEEIEVVELRGAGHRSNGIHAAASDVDDPADSNLLQIGQRVQKRRAKKPAAVGEKAKRGAVTKRGANATGKPAAAPAAAAVTGGKN